jgi:CHAD domain-containing protein
MKTKESLRHGFRHACHQHVKKALASLDEPNQPEAIHAVRKEIKKMRAVLRLAREGLKRRDYRKISKAMRLAAKPLSAPRDALVTEKALAKLGGSKTFANVRSALKVHSKREERRYQEDGTGGVTRYILRKLLKPTADLKTDHSGWRDVCRCLCKSYARGRRAYLIAMRHPTPINFHEWRKQVKNLSDQLDFICPAWPQRTKDMVSDLKSLGNQLGDDHDLVLLEQFIQDQCAHCEETTKLVRLIDSKRAELQADIDNSGSVLYKPTPEQFCRRLKEDWKAWNPGRHG